MKKALLILGTVVVLIGVTVYADRATRLKPRNSVDSAVHADAVALGTPEPEVTFESLDGKDVPLSEYKGKVVLVNFWATWCEPCQIEIPWLIEMQQKYSSKGFIVRSEEHTSELQSRLHLVCRLLLEKKNLISAPPQHEHAS